MLSTNKAREKALQLVHDVIGLVYCYPSSFNHRDYRKDIALNNAKTIVKKTCNEVLALAGLPLETIEFWQSVVQELALLMEADIFVSQNMFSNSTLMPGKSVRFGIELRHLEKLEKALRAKNFTNYQLINRTAETVVLRIIVDSQKDVAFITQLVNNFQKSK